MAILCGADLVINLSDIDGLYDSDPHRNPDAKLIPVVHEIDDRLRALAGGSGSSVGTGGMKSKLMAAELLLAKNIDMVIADGQHPERLAEICAGEMIGTRFTAR